MKKEKRLIFACDLQDPREAMKIVREVSDFIDAVKINYPLILSTEIDFIEKLSDFCDVIADFKVADVPHINKIISKKVFENKGSGIICHSFLGKESLLACKEVAEKFDGSVYSVVEMSHPGAEKFIHKHVKELIGISKEVGVNGVIAPGNDLKRLKRVRELVPSKFEVLSPGIGNQGGKAKQAIEAGADYVIVGRKIYQSSQPRKVAKKLSKEIKKY